MHFIKIVVNFVRNVVGLHRGVFEMSSLFYNRICRNHDNELVTEIRIGLPIFLRKYLDLLVYM
jgi:hypothetical protein